MPSSIMTQDFESKMKVMKFKKEKMKEWVAVIYNCAHVFKKIVIGEDETLGSLKI